MSERLDELESLLLGGDRRALSRVLTWVENGDERGREMSRRLYRAAGGHGSSA